MFDSMVISTHVSPMLSNLTPKQQRVFEALVTLTQEWGRPPSQSELARHLGYPSKTSIRQYYAALKRKGYLDLKGYRWRGVIVKLPVVGEVAAGTPILAEENIQGYLPIDGELLGGKPARHFILRAKGDSMDLAGIETGDYLLTEQRPDAEAGEMVVALIGDEATVKFYKPGPDFAVLLPRSSNPQHQPIVVRQDFAIQGVVRKVFKQHDLHL